MRHTSFNAMGQPSGAGLRLTRLPVFRSTLWLALATVSLAATAAPIPAPEKLLPENTLFLMTAPDFAKVRELSAKTPLRQCWDDPAMKPFRDKFVSKFEEEFLQPLERELNVKFEDYTSLLQGQLTLAVIQSGTSEDVQPPGLLVLLDSKDKSAQLKKQLADLRKRWTDAGKTLKQEKIRDIEFIVLPLSTNDVPKTLRKFFPPAAETQELGDEDKPKTPAHPNEVVLGQVESLLIAGNSTKAVEQVLTRLGGGSAPTLGEVAAYQANHQALFRDAPLYGWANAKALVELWTHHKAKSENPDAPNPFDLDPEKVVSATGLLGLKSVAASLRDSNDGQTMQIFVGVPEAGRQGVFKILTGEAKETSAPPFVPADAVKFQRWRIDGQKAWAALEKMLNDISPQAITMLNYALDAAKDKDPSFDLRKNLIGNLGDDIISYEKAPRGTTAPSLYLLGSPHAEELAIALKGLMGLAGSASGSSPEEREFLGRKIYSSPPLPPMGVDKSSGPQKLSFAASGGYVALSTDAATLEQYLRSSDSQAKALRDVPGLTEAAQKVTGPGTSLFGYENQTETMKVLFEALKKSDPDSTESTSLLPANLNLPAGVPDLKSWMDFSLLPSFDKVAKYFSFTVYGGSSTADGLSFKWFSPPPPAARK